MLYLWARALPPGATVVEIGCYGGLSTSYLAAGIRDNAGARIYAIDPFDSDLEQQAVLTDHRVALEDKPTVDGVRQRLQRAGFGERVTLIEGFSQEVARGWEREIDFLWIDGNHEQALQDYLDFARHLRAGARVAVHDAHPRYGYDSVVRDVRKIFADDAQWRDLEHVKSIISGLRCAD